MNSIVCSKFPKLLNREFSKTSRSERSGKLTKNHEVRCNNQGRDRIYPKRFIGICWIDGENTSLNQMLVLAGWALNFEPYAKVRFRSVMSKAYFSEPPARGLLVLKSFDGTTPRQRISTVTNRTGLNPAAARRFLLTLVDLGHAGTDGDLFYLQPRVLDLGYRYLASVDVGGLVQRLLTELADRIQEATTFGVLDGKDVLIVARASKRLFDLHVGEGSRLPLLQPL
jgi:hypothetical protein